MRTSMIELTKETKQDYTGIGIFDGYNKDGNKF